MSLVKKSPAYESEQGQSDNSQQIQEQQQFERLTELRS